MTNPPPGKGELEFTSSAILLGFKFQVAGAPFFTLQNSENSPLLRITSDGDLVLLTGDVHPMSSFQPIEGVQEFIVKQGESNYLALVDSTTGDLYLKGKLYEAKGFLLTIPAKSLKIEDSSGATVAFINSSGYFDPFVEPVFPWIVPAGSLILAGDINSPSP